MNAWVTQLRKGLVEYCVLKVLATGESYGYEIIQRLRTMDTLAITECTVYPILTRLRNEEYLSVRAEDSPNGPPRRYYKLTTLGRHRLSEMNVYWDDLSYAIGKLGT
jgi:PadR family transcriptional regulator, regulatory protein PadR